MSTAFLSHGVAKLLRQVEGSSRRSGALVMIAVNQHVVSNFLGQIR
jgi:hypothetical protein